MTDRASFESLRDDLLRWAGGAMTLAEAAEALGVTRQDLHKRIKAGAALGMMRDDEIVVPRIQFVELGERTAILPSLGEVLRVFEEGKAQGWPALQFLVAPSPNLDGRPPIDVLREAAAGGGHGGDKVLGVVHAARGHLVLDEG